MNGRRRAHRCAASLLIGLIMGTTIVGTARAQQIDLASQTANRDRKAAEAALARRVTLELTHVSLKRALDTVSRVAGVVVQYRLPLLQRVTTPVDVHLVDVSLAVAFERVLDGTNLRVIIDGQGELSVVTVSGGAADSGRAEGVLTGRVVDSATGRGLQGATVRVQGERDVVTSQNGEFTLRGLAAGPHAVTVRLFGYRVAQRVVDVENDTRSTLVVTLARSATMLSGVVTTATGVQARRTIGNDVTSLNVDSIQMTAPITSVTDLLEARVPGLQVLRSSGVPGAPSRVRLRSVGSLNGNNDPIVIVDGVRVFAQQSDTLLGSQSLAKSTLHSGNTSSGTAPGPFGVPSPLDQIDPNAIATIDVFKGPSATSLYGADAANGVIVITTKRGRPGKAHWTTSLSRDVSYIPGRYPDVVHTFGHDFTGGSPSPLECENWSFRCIRDSVIRFQALNEPELTVLGRGHRSEASVGVSGGVSALTYRLTGTGSDDIGLFKLPAIEEERYRKFTGADAPEWMRRPDNLRRWAVDGNIRLGITPSTSVAVTSALVNSDQQQSSIDLAIGQLVNKYIDLTQLDATPLIKNFYERSTSGSLTSTTSLQLESSAIPRLPLSANIGLNTIDRSDKILVPRGVPSGVREGFGTDEDSAGRFSVGTGRTIMRSLGVRGSQIVLGRYIRANVGADVVSTESELLRASIGSIPAGVTEPTYFGCPSDVTDVRQCGTASRSTQQTSSHGWYLEPQLAVNSRFFVTPGFRFDGGSTSGARAGLSGFPKLNFSWVALDREGAPPLFGILSMLRPRLALGMAGVQPGPSQRLRLLADTTVIAGGSSGVFITGLGNTMLRAERSQEIEGGFDAELWDGRVAVTLSGYRNMRHNALVDIDVAQSVYGGGRIQTNVGLIRKAGTEVTANAQLVRHALVGWNVQGTLSKSGNRVMRLGPGQQPITFGGGDGVFTRIVAGYPLFGRWALPIASFRDADQNGRIDATEVLLGDTAVYVGPEEPNYELTFGTDLTLWRFSAHATFAYTDGLTQYNSASQGLSRGLYDPSAPLGAQAAAVAASPQIGTAYGLVESVSTLRFQTLSLNFDVPTSFARRVRSQSIVVALQGSNLGLRTNYRGKDPNVNAFVTGNQTVDSGQLPQPRTWALRLSLAY